MYSNQYETHKKFRKRIRYVYQMRRWLHIQKRTLIFSTTYFYPAIFIKLKKINRMNCPSKKQKIKQEKDQINIWQTKRSRVNIWHYPTCCEFRLQLPSTNSGIRRYKVCPRINFISIRHYLYSISSKFCRFAISKQVSFSQQSREIERGENYCIQKKHTTGNREIS